MIRPPSRTDCPAGIATIARASRRPACGWWTTATCATSMSRVPRADLRASTGHARGAIHRALAGRVEVICALEMGGNNPLVVWRPEDIEAAAVNVVLSAFITSGQRCTCARRLIVPDDGDDLEKALREAESHARTRGRR